MKRFDLGEKIRLVAEYRFQLGGGGLRTSLGRGEWLGKPWRVVRKALESLTGGGGVR